MSFLPNTVFVVGAGAGADIQMPMGNTLAQRIREGGVFKFEHGSEITSGDKRLFWALQRAVPREGLNEVLQHIRRIANGISTSDSIDTFIDRTEDRNIARAGKLLIAHYILEAERNSRFAVNWRNGDGELSIPELHDTWFAKFSTMLFSGVRSSELDRLVGRVQIVCFNYDRCLERYLTEALRQGFELPWQEAHALVSKMTIIHPYGDLGPLPQLPTVRAPGTVAFGHPLDEVDISVVASRLSTFTEEMSDQDRVSRIRKLIGDAERLVFLGFAFHSPNMRLMTVPGGGPANMFGSGIGLSQQEVESLKSICLGMVGQGTHRKILDRVRIEVDRDCSQLLTIHRLNLLE